VHRINEPDIRRTNCQNFLTSLPLRSHAGGDHDQHQTYTFVQTNHPHDVFLPFHLCRSGHSIHLVYGVVRPQHLLKPSRPVVSPMLLIKKNTKVDFNYSHQSTRSCLPSTGQPNSAASYTTQFNLHVRLYAGLGIAYAFRICSGI